MSVADVVWSGWQCSRRRLPSVWFVLCRGCSRRTIMQDQVVDNLDAAPPTTRLPVLPAGGMQPARYVDTAAFAEIPGADLSRPTPRGRQQRSPRCR